MCSYYGIIFIYGVLKRLKFRTYIIVQKKEKNMNIIFESVAYYDCKNNLSYSQKTCMKYIYGSKHALQRKWLSVKYVIKYVIRKYVI